MLHRGSVEFGELLRRLRRRAEATHPERLHLRRERQKLPNDLLCHLCWDSRGLLVPEQALARQDRLREWAANIALPKLLRGLLQRRRGGLIRARDRLLNHRNVGLHPARAERFEQLPQHFLPHRARLAQKRLSILRQQLLQRRCISLRRLPLCGWCSQA